MKLGLGPKVNANEVKNMEALVEVSVKEGKSSFWWWKT